MLSSSWRALRPATLALGCGAFALNTVPCAAVESGFPNRPITIIVGSEPGGSTDVFARLLAANAEPILGQRILVEDRPGATGAVAMNLLLKARPDGYTLVFASNATLTTIPYTMKVAYTPDSYRPLVQVGYGSYVMCVAPGFPADTGQAFIEQLKRNPDKFSYSVDGIGGPMHLAASQIFKRIGTTEVAVPFNGSGEMATSFLGGNIDIYGGGLQAILPHVAAGKAKCLLLTSPEGNPALPKASNLREVGLDGVTGGLWWGLIGPKDLPADVVALLEDKFTEAARSPAMAENLRRLSAQP